MQKEGITSQNQLKMKSNNNEEKKNSKRKKKWKLLERKLRCIARATFNAKGTHKRELQAGFQLAHIIKFYFYLYVCFLHVVHLLYLAVSLVFLFVSEASARKLIDIYCNVPDYGKAHLFKRILSTEKNCNTRDTSNVNDKTIQINQINKSLVLWLAQVGSLLVFIAIRAIYYFNGSTIFIKSTSL